MTSRARRILIQVGIFALAGVLLYLAFRGAELDKIAEALREADYGWLVPLFVVTMLSHLLRAWRWQVLLEALPPRSPEAGPPRVSLKTAFYSLMIGYMVNYAVPRMGEVVRTADVAAQEKLSFSGVLGTVVVERILDVLVLALGLVVSVLLLFDQMGAIQEHLIDPLLQNIGQTPALLLGGLLLGIAAVVVFIYWTAFRPEDARLRRFWNKRLRSIWMSFKDGLATVLRSPRRFTLVFSTLAIWFCYLLMAYVPLLLFDLVGPYNLSLLDTLSIMLLGAVGVVIPLPGGVGSFHYITRQTLVFLFGVNESLAVTYAFFVHGAQLVFFVIVGSLCLLLQGSSLSTLYSRVKATQQEPQPPPDTARPDDTDAPSSTAETRHDQTPNQP
ncbi:MAG: lysylphosphatidylglycerol synthase transmembrane domain-containing protein [Rhodothermales bacterium]